MTSDAFATGVAPVAGDAGGTASVAQMKRPGEAPCFPGAMLDSTFSLAGCMHEFR
jgi:hypothetical protein